MITYANQLVALHEAIVNRQIDQMLPLIHPARHNSFPPAQRLAVYYEGYEARLYDAILTDYPQTAEYLGRQAFIDSAYAYIRATPSPFWDLNLYSIAYAGFLKNFISDTTAQNIAACESAQVEVYWLPESEAWKPSPEISPEILLDMPLRLRTASRLLAAPTPSFVLRHNGSVCIHALENNEYQALQQPTFGEALQQAVSPEQAQAWLTRWIAEGFLT